MLVTLEAMVSSGLYVIDHLQGSYFQLILQIEFVQDKATKQSFPRSQCVLEGILELGTSTAHQTEHQALTSNSQVRALQHPVIWRYWMW